MRIAEITDPTPEYRRLKGELERLRASDPLHRKVDWMKSQDDDSRYDDPDYQRKMQYFDKLRKVFIARWRDLTSRVDRLRGESLLHKLRDKPSGMFVAYDTVPGVESPAYLDEIGLLIHQQNADLDFPADEAITRFVGHVHGFNSPGEIGFWSEGALEDAYSSDNPNEKGQLIRQQLEAGMAPIKQLLRARFGDTIYLYRSQRPLEPGQKHRGVLSWTASQRFANYHGGDKFQKIEKAIPLEDIVWITDRANQQEFICFNRRGAAHYIGAPMSEAVSVDPNREWPIKASKDANRGFPFASEQEALAYCQKWLSQVPSRKYRFTLRAWEGHDGWLAIVVRKDGREFFLE